MPKQRHLHPQYQSMAESDKGRAHLYFTVYIFTFVLMKDMCYSLFEKKKKKKV